MILSDLEGRLDGQSKVIFDLLWEIVNGTVPHMDHFSVEEVKALFRGEDVQGVKSPFVLLSKNMMVRRMPDMVLKTTKDQDAIRRQMVVCRMLDTVNKMLEILALESESLEVADISF